MPKKALVTLALGQHYVSMFNTLCRSNWSAYADRHGYDLIVIDAPLDRSERASKRSPAWQKLLMLSQPWSSRYEQLIWIDSDILINNTLAPDIGGSTPPEKNGAVEAWSIPTRELHDIGLARLFATWKSQGVPYIDNQQPEMYYKNRGFEGGDVFEKVVQAGVFVCSPKYHRTLFEHVYYTYEDHHGPAWNYEIPAFSYEVIKHDLQHWISPHFNFCVSDLVAAFYPFLFQEHPRSLSRRVLQVVNKGLQKKATSPSFHLAGTKCKPYRISMNWVTSSILPAVPNGCGPCIRI